MQAREDSLGENPIGNSESPHCETECSPHWLTQIMHEASKIGLDVQASGIWSSTPENTTEMLQRFSTILCSHENSPPEVLTWISAMEDHRLQERVAEHPNTPLDLLEKLAANTHPDVRAAVGENPNASFELLFTLARDEHADVRYRLAENKNLPAEIVGMLCEDDNPYVAHKAQENARRNTGSHNGDLFTDKLRVLIVDDDDVTRLILTLSLRTDPLIQVIGQATNGQSGIKMAIEMQPDIVLMDIGMPIMNGLNAMAEIKSLLPFTKVIMVTAHDSPEEIVSAFGHGAEGYHLKSTPNRDLGKAIRIVVNGGYWLDPGIASMVLRQLSRKIDSMQRSYREMEESEDIEARALPNPVEALISISEEFYRSDKLVEARKICDSAFYLSRTLYGDESAFTRRVMSRLAELCFLEEEYEVSERTYLALAQSQSIQHELDAPELETYLSLLAKFYEFRRNYEQAELFYLWLLRVRERAGSWEAVEHAKERLDDIQQRARKSAS